MAVMQKLDVPAAPQAPLEKGDYVLATKWDDGDPQDHWCVGFFDGMLKHNDLDTDRYLVADSNYKPFRANGFRRAERISQERGEWLLQNANMIESSGKSLWEWKDEPATDPRVGDEDKTLIAYCERIATLEAQLASANEIARGTSNGNRVLIEKIQKAEASNAALCETIGEMTRAADANHKTFKETEAEAARLRVALEEYADPTNWIGYPLIRLWSKREAGYERAQAALEAPEAARGVEE